MWNCRVEAKVDATKGQLSPTPLTTSGMLALGLLAAMGQMAALPGCADDEPAGFQGQDQSSPPGDDGAATSSPTPLTTTWSFSSGTYAVTIDVLLENGCESQAGGIHVHVGEVQSTDFSVDGKSIEAQVDDMLMSGERAGDAFTLEGDMLMDVGAYSGIDCLFIFNAIMDASIVADDSFKYEMANVISKDSGRDCDLLIGEQGLVPELPCYQRWTGEGSLDR